MTFPASFHDLDGASVFITGGGSGIGAVLTDGFLAQGARVAFIGRSDATSFCDRMEASHGRRPLFLRGDISETARLRAGLDEARAAHGPVTVLVNNAANDQRHTTEEVTEEFWEWSVGVNFKAYFFACQAAVAQMREAGGGAIVNFSSVSYMMGNAGYPIYASCNAAITGLTRSLAREFGREQIRVNALMPGWVLTERQKELWASEEALSAHLARQCLPETLSPEDMLGGALFLASDASRMMTGQALVIDGGVVVTG